MNKEGKEDANLNEEVREEHEVNRAHPSEHPSIVQDGYQRTADATGTLRRNGRPDLSLTHATDSWEGNHINSAKILWGVSWKPILWGVSARRISSSTGPCNGHPDGPPESFQVLVLVLPCFAG